jgi:hypothetical protein
MLLQALGFEVIFTYEIEQLFKENIYTHEKLLMCSLTK